jgi:hypothetical protein
VRARHVLTAARVVPMLGAQFCVGTIKDNYLGLIGEAQ